MEEVSSQICEKEMFSSPSANKNTDELNVVDDDDKHILDDLMELESLENVTIPGDWSIDLSISCYNMSFSPDHVSPSRS